MRAVLLERSVEDEGQGSGETVEDKVFVGKHRLYTVHLSTETELAVGIRLVKRGENAVSHATLRLQLRRCQK